MPKKKQILSITKNESSTRDWEKAENIMSNQMKTRFRIPNF